MISKLKVVEQGGAVGSSEVTDDGRVVSGNPGYVNAQVNVCG